MEWIPPPTGRRGRQQSFSDAAIQTCLTMKVLFGMPLRQTTGFVQSLLRLVGLDWNVPDFSTLCRRQRALNVSIPYRGGAGPLNLLTIVFTRERFGKNKAFGCFGWIFGISELLQVAPIL